MSDKSENCPVCLKELKVHAIQNFIDCIQVLINQNKDDSNSITLLSIVNGISNFVNRFNQLA